MARDTRIDGIFFLKKCCYTVHHRIPKLFDFLDCGRMYQYRQKTYHININFTTTVLLHDKQPNQSRRQKILIILIRTRK